jgi:hypothetical protein
MSGGDLSVKPRKRDGYYERANTSHRVFLEFVGNRRCGAVAVGVTTSRFLMLKALYALRYPIA